MFGYDVQVVLGSAFPLLSTQDGKVAQTCATAISSQDRSVWERKM